MRNELFLLTVDVFLPYLIVQLCHNSADIWVQPILTFGGQSCNVQATMRVFVTLHFASWFIPYLVMLRSFHAFWISRIRWHTGCMRLAKGVVMLEYSWDQVVIWNAPTRPIPNMHRQHFNAATGTYRCSVFAWNYVFRVSGTKYLRKLYSLSLFTLSQYPSLSCIRIKFSPRFKWSYGGRQSLEVISYLRWCWNLFDSTNHIDCDCVSRTGSYKATSKLVKILRITLLCSYS